MTEEDKQFTHGILYAIQEFVDMGNRGCAETIVHNSGIPKYDFIECQQESAHNNEMMFNFFDEYFENK